MSEATSGIFMVPLNPAYRCAPAGFSLKDIDRESFDIIPMAKRDQ
jgi:hypothetical protein